MLNRFLIVSMTIVIFLACQKQEIQIEEEEKTTGIPVEAMVIQSKVVIQDFPLTGITEPVASVDLISEVSGKVTRINKKLGDPVSRRDTLAIIDDRIPYSQYRQARAQVLSAENNLKITELNLESDKSLLASEDISQLAYENALLTVKNARANLLAAQANYELMEKRYRDTRITSPIQGHISRKYINLGTMVIPNMELYRVIDLRTVKITVSVPQSIISRVSKGTPAAITVGALNAKGFSGIVQHVSPQADERIGGFAAEIYMKNTATLAVQAGMTVKIDLMLSSAEKRIVVPDYALVSKNDSTYVYRIENQVARLVPVTIEETFGSQLAIGTGIAQGDTIVVVGMKNLGVETSVWIEALNP